MQQGFNSITQRTGLSNLPTEISSKVSSLGTKALGTSHDSALVAWYEEAYAYYNAVISGDPNTPRANPQEWNNFLTQMEWAAGQLGYAAPQGRAWNPMGAGQGPGLGDPMHVPPPQGAKRGVMDNWVYSEETAAITFADGNSTNDIWSNKVKIDVPSLSAKIRSEITQDTRLSPPERVLKITVTDPATQTQSVYFVHDFEDAEIEIRSPEQHQVTISGGSHVTWSEFSKADSSGKPDASIEGILDPETGNIIYEPEYAGDTVDFFSNPGKDQTHVVYADANISVKPSDQVKLEDGPGGQIVVTVTHRDGSKDTYKVHKGYQVNVNVNEEYIEGEIPASIQGRVTINGKERPAEASVAGELASEGVWRYKPAVSGKPIDFLAQTGGEQFHEVHADANISVQPTDKVLVKADPNGKVIFIFVTHNDGSKDTYMIQEGYKVNVNAKEGQFVGDIPSSIKDRVTINQTALESTDAAEAMISTLLDMTGRGADQVGQLLSALKAAGYDYKTIEEFKQAIKSGAFPGAEPNKQLLRFLVIFDNGKGGLHTFTEGIIGKTASENQSLRNSATQRMGEWLSKLYPNDLIDSYVPTSDPYTMGFARNGERFEWSAYYSVSGLQTGIYPG